MEVIQTEFMWMNINSTITASEIRLWWLSLLLTGMKAILILPYAAE